MNDKDNSPLTPWYPPSIKPLASRPGWYETSCYPRKYHVLDYWDGEQWGDGYHPYIDDTQISLFWRGLAELSK